MVTTTVLVIIIIISVLKVFINLLTQQANGQLEYNSSSAQEQDKTKTK
jgi:hypothetical protein